MKMMKTEQGKIFKILSKSKLSTNNYLGLISSNFRISELPQNLEDEKWRLSIFVYYTKKTEKSIWISGKGFFPFKANLALIY